MNYLDKSRKALYEKLISLGYFKEEDGTVNLGYEDFAANLNDEEMIGLLYRNLLEDGVLKGEDGKETVTEENFRNQFGSIRLPSTPIEQKLYDAVSDLVNDEGFGVHNDLFTLGLTSLSAMNLAARIQHEYAVRVTVEQIGQNPTVAKLAKLVESGISTDAAHKGNPLF